MRREHLTQEQRRLIDLMRWIEFGRIEGLRIQGGNPVWEPLPPIYRQILMGRKQRSKSSSQQGDFDLKSQMVDLIHLLEHEGSTLIERIEVQDGLPFRVTLKTEEVPDNEMS